MGSWLTVCCTTLISTVISTAEFHDFLCASYNVTPPLTYKRNEMVDLSNFLYVTDLAADTEG